MGTAYKDAGTLGCILDFINVKFNTLGGTKVLALNLLAFGKDGVCLAKVDADVVADVSLNDTGYDIVFFLIINVVYDASFLFTNLLGDYVTGVLSGDTAEFLGLDVNLNDVAKLIFGFNLSGVL